MADADVSNANDRRVDRVDVIDRRLMDRWFVGIFLGRVRSEERT